MAEPAAGDAAAALTGLGTQLRHVLDLMDGDIATVLADLGVAGYRPRFSPVVRALVALGPVPIRELASAISVTHSAASQTVAQMRTRGLVVLRPGEDARQRVVHLTAKARDLLPRIEAEWAATASAAAEMDAELPFPLAELVPAIAAALRQRSFRQRITESPWAREHPEFTAALAAGRGWSNTLPGLLTDVTPLRESAQFRRLFTGSLLSSVGSALTGFAIPLQVYDITRSPFAVGAIGLVALGPMLTIGLLGGPLIDALDRRKLVLVTSICQAGVSAVLAAQAFAGLSVLWLLYALIAVQSALAALNMPARRTLIPSLLPPDRLPAGLALNRISFQVTLIVGPALGGLITVAGGLKACYLIDVISFGGALYGVSLLPPMPPQPGTTRPGPRAVAEGLRFIRRSQVLAGAFVTDLNATVFALPVALFPAINAERFGGNPATLGLFTTAIGVGGLLSSACTGPLRQLSRQGRAMLCMVTIWGAAFAGFALARSLWLTLTLLAIAGAADTFAVVIRGTIVQAVTTDALRGLLTAAEYVIGSGGESLGRLESGIVGSLASPVVSALSGGLITVALSAVIPLALPGFAGYRALQPAPVQDAPDDAGELNESARA